MSRYEKRGIPDDLLTSNFEGERRIKTSGSISSEDGKQVFATEFGELTTASRIDYVSINYHYGISTRDTKDASTGTGTVTHIGSDAVVSCGTGIGTGELRSIDAIRYRAGHEVLCMFTHNQTALETGVKVKHGLLDDANGLAIGSNDTEFGVWFNEGGNSNFIAQSNFNCDKLDGTGHSGFNIDTTKRNLFCITFGYLSIAPIRYYVHTNDKWIEFHRLDFINSQEVGHLKNPSLPITLRVRRESGTGTAVQAKAGSWRASIVAGSERESASERWFSFTEATQDLGSINIATNPTQFHNIFTLKSADIFNGKINHVRAEISVVSFLTDGNKGVEFSSHINGTLTGNSAFTDISTSNSVMSVSTGGLVENNLAGGATVLGKASDRRTDLRGTGIYLRAGQSLTVGARGVDGSAFVGDVAVSFRWVEEF